ncbi:MAG: methyl-accepting chemotaxis protein [Clostridia bacterium]|nr:methyl-accepting chemotaxis protein [Clostridia bacterium]
MLKFKFKKSVFGNKSPNESDNTDKSLSIKSQNRLASFINIIIHSGTVLRRTKIQTRLMISFMFLCLTPLVFLGIQSYSSSSGSIRNKISTYSVQVMDQVATNLNLQLSKFISDSVEITSSKEIQEAYPAFAKSDMFERGTIANRVRDILSAKFAAVKTNISDVELITTTPDRARFGIFGYDRQEGVWPKETIENVVNSTSNEMDAVISFERTEDKDNNIFISRSVKSNKNRGKNIGFIFIAVKEGLFSDVYKQINLGENVDMFIIDGKGTVVSSRNPKVIPVGEPYKDKSLVKKLVTSKNKWFDHDGYMVAYSKIESTADWNIVCTIPYNYLNKENDKILVNLILIISVCFVLALLLSFIISKTISNPLTKLVSVMKRAKDGDLSASITDKSNDELGQVTNNFNEMLTNISKLVSKVNTSAQNVLNCAEKITSSSEQSYVASEQIALTIQEVAKGAASQAEEVSVSVSHMNVLACGINRVDDGMRNVSTVIGDTKKLSENAQDVVKALNNRAVETSSVSDKIVTQINSLNDDMKEIKKIVKVIVGIAEQTNLLSLNAAIEASRAGAAGKGFAVVAGEVKKLADQSKEASITISNIISKIQQKTESTVNEANTASEIVSHQMDAVSQTDNSFKIIFNSMENIAKHMSEVDNSVKEMLDCKEKAIESIESISAVSQQAAATSEEVSASTEEQMACSEQLSHLAKELNEMAQELNDAISIFKV